MPTSRKKTKPVTTWHIALLRGVNVGGGKKVPMATLRDIAESLGFEEARTLLNSGNLVYRTSMTPADAERTLHEAILTALQIDTTIFVRTPEELRRILAENPLREEALAEPSKVLVTVWTRDTTTAHLAPLADASTEDERFVVGPRAAYLWFPQGIAASVVYEKAARPLGNRVTARNWNTMQKLLALTDDTAGA